MKVNRTTKIKKKIILFLSAGIALSAAKTITKQSLVLKEIAEEWKSINRHSLRSSLISLYESKVIGLKPKGGSYEIILLSGGKKLAALFNLENIKIKKQDRWDGLWRIALFDIPERFKKVRDAMRFHLKDMGFVEYQKSVFITPYPCEKELKFVAEFFHARKFVRLIVAKAIDKEPEFKRKWNIN